MAPLTPSGVKSRSFEPGELDNMAEVAQPGPSGANAKRRPTRWSARRRRDAWFMLMVVLLGTVTVFVLSNGIAQRSGPTNVTWPGTSPTIVTTVSATSGTAVPTTAATVRAAQMRLYPFPQSNVGLMQPAADAQGNVWVGEMYANRLARLDSGAGMVTTWEPPNGKNGIMTTTIDAQGNIWLVEQGANYIGHFDPVTQSFRTFPLGTMNGRPLGPQDLQFDASGKLWFTGLSDGRIGRLDPTTGTVQTWSIPSSCRRHWLLSVQSHSDTQWAGLVR